MIRIAPLAPSDFDAWHPLWRGYQTFYKTDIPETTTRVSFDRMLDPTEPMAGALAWRDGQAVGMVHWLFHRSTWTVENSCYLQDLFVDPATRGGGIGRQLIEHVYAEASVKNCSRVYWLTHETNHDAMQLYDRIGTKSGFLVYRKALT